MIQRKKPLTAKCFHKYSPLSFILLSNLEESHWNHSNQQWLHSVGFVIFPSMRIALELASETQKKKGLLKDSFRGLLGPSTDSWTSVPSSDISNITLLIT